MQLPLYQIDAFSNRPFGGNPAAVVPLDAWLPDGTLQAIAQENNLAETAYLVPEGEGYRIRWFTPEVEVRLCGHATLASAWVVFHRLRPGSAVVRLQSLSGPLTVTRSGDRLTLDFPALPATECAPPPGARDALGAPFEACWRARDLMFVFRSEREVRDLRPDLQRLRFPDALGVIVTAPGEDCDFVSRFFAPGAGIPEDPATGSSHCTLAPYWAARLGKSELFARQVSARGGEFWCRAAGERVEIGGHCVPYLEGTVFLPDAAG